MSERGEAEPEIETEKEKYCDRKKRNPPGEGARLGNYATGVPHMSVFIFVPQRAYEWALHFFSLPVLG